MFIEAPNFCVWCLHNVPKVFMVEFILPLQLFTAHKNNENTTRLTQLQQLCRDGFTDAGAAACHYRNFVFEQARSEDTGRRHRAPDPREEGHAPSGPVGVPCSRWAFLVVGGFCKCYTDLQ